MREKLVINGNDLMALSPGSVPEGRMLKVEHIWASESVIHLSGKQKTYRAAQAGGVKVTVNPGDTFVIPLSVKQVLESAYATFGEITLIETLSEPSEERVWRGYLSELEISEKAGSTRELYNYSFTLIQEPED